MSLAKLKNEITNDPLTRGYSGMTDQEIADSLNTVDRVANLNSLSGSEMFGAMEPADYTALTADKKNEWLSVCAIDSVDPFGPVVDVVKDIWGDTSQTVTNLAALRKETLSRAAELGLPKVKEGHIEEAR